MPKSVEFPYASRKWDQYRRFYVTRYGNTLVHFETGEMIITRCGFKPASRRFRPDYGIQFVNATDGCDALHKLETTSGERVRKTWLGGGVFMIDYETKQLVPLHYATPRQVGGVNEIPEELARGLVYAYCGGAARKWVSTGRVHYRTPAKLDKAQKEQLKHVLMVCRTQAKLGVLETVERDMATHYTKAHRLRTEQKAEHIVKGYQPVDYKFALQFSVEDMVPYERWVLARHGYKPLFDFHQDNELRIAE